MMRRIFIICAVFILWNAVLAVNASEANDAETASVSNDTAGDASVSAGTASVSGETAAPVADVPGLGELTQEDIDGLGFFTKELIDEYGGAAGTYPVTVVREPELELEYNAELDRYRYILPDGQWVECNIPQGAFCRGSATFRSSDDISNLAVYKDGKVYRGSSPFQEVGSYVVTWWDFNVNGDADFAYRLDYVFTIYSDPRMNISFINAPEGMEISELRFNGKSRDLSGEKCALLVADGDYSFVFTGGGAVFETDFIRDTVPPVIMFDPDYSYEGVMEKTPRFNVPDRSAKLSVLRNYVDVELPYGEIPVNGYYEMRVSDSAGNTRRYRFTVKAPLPFFTKRLVIIPAVAAAAILMIVLNTRRNTRVR